MHHVPLRATVHTFENEEDYREDAILIFQPNVMFTFKVMFCQDSHRTLLSEVGSRLPLLYTASQYLPWSKTLTQACLDAHCP
jgi:hypothetical protein